MKIGYLVNQYPMPSQTFIRREIVALEQLGFEVVRFALQPWPGQLVDAADQAEADATRYVKGGGVLGLGAALVRSALTRPTAFIAAWRLSRAVARRSDRSSLYHLAYLAEACILHAWAVAAGVRHIHVHFATNSTEVAMLARTLGGPPYSMMVHGPEEFDRASCLSLDEKIRRAAFVATITSYARSQLFRWCPHDAWNKIQIVRCGLDRAFLDSEATDPPDVPRLVCVGRLCEQKGQLLLLEAAALLAARDREFELVLVGDGEMRPALEEKIVASGLQRRVVLSGWASNEAVQGAIRDARALVLASFAEGLPVVIMEALAMCRPVISTWIAGIPELVEDGVNGWLVVAGDAQRLADALEAALTTPVDRLAGMGRAGQAAVAERHDACKEARVLAGLIEGSQASGRS